MNASLVYELNAAKHLKINEKKKHLRQKPLEDGASSGFSGQKSVPE